MQLIRLANLLLSQLYTSSAIAHAEDEAEASYVDAPRPNFMAARFPGNSSRGITETSGYDGAATRRVRFSDLWADAAGDCGPQRGGNVGEAIIKALTSETVAARAKVEASIARLKVELEQANTRLSKSEAEQVQIKTQITLQEERVELAQLDLTRGLTIAEKVYMARKDVETRRSTLLAAQQELATHHRFLNSVHRAEANVTDLDFDLAFSNRTRLTMEETPICAWRESRFAFFAQSLCAAFFPKIQAFRYI